MGYFPGSYRLHLLVRPEFVEIPVGGTEDDSNSAELRGTGPIHLDMQRGPVGGCHHSLIFHLARPDTLSRTRRVHTAIFFRTGSTRGANAGHFAVDRANVKLGKPMDSDVTPLAWPRRESGVPPPPTGGTTSRHDTKVANVVRAAPCGSGSVQLVAESSLAQYLHLVASTGRSPDRQCGHFLVGAGLPKTVVPCLFI